MVSHLVFLTVGSLFEKLINHVYFDSGSRYKRNTHAQKSERDQLPRIVEARASQRRRYPSSTVQINCCKGDSTHSSLRIRHLLVPQVQQGGNWNEFLLYDFSVISFVGKLHFFSARSPGIEEAVRSNVRTDQEKSMAYEFLTGKYNELDRLDDTSL